MLLFEDEAQSSFRDHVDAGIRYILPRAVTVEELSSGMPDFFLLRYAGDFATERGGILRGTLGLRYDTPETPSESPTGTGEEPLEGETEVVEEPAEPVTLRPVPFVAGYSRLRLRPFGDDDVQSGQWHKIDALEQSRLSMLAYLDTSEAQILRSLLSEESEVVSIELYLVFRGLVPGLPWLVRADTVQLNAHLQSILGEVPATADQVVAAFLSLPDEGLSWRFLGDPGDEAEHLPAETLRMQAALHALGHLFEPVERPDYRTPLQYRYVPRDHELSPDVSIGLFNYRQEERAFSIDWSISDLFDRLAPEDRDRLFPTVTKVSPFSRVRIHVINSLPFDPDFVTGVTVDVRYVGAQGIFENRSFRFAAGDEQVVSFSTFHPALTGSLDLQYRITAILAPPSPDEWPRVVQRGFAAGEGTVVDVNPMTAGIEFVHCSADPAVFSRSEAIDVTLAMPESDETLAGIQLTGDRPSAWIALPDLDPDALLRVTCRAHPPADLDAEPLTIRDELLTGREVSIHAFQLEVMEPDEITVFLDEQAGERYPFVAFELTPDEDSDEGVLRSLDPGRTYSWRLHRDGIFSPLLYRYRLHVVERNGAGGTKPMVITPWFEASDHQHTLNADFIEERMNPP